MNAPLVDVIDALLAVCGGEPDVDGAVYGVGPLAGVRILDGPPAANLDETDVVAFGLAVTQATGATGAARQGYGGQRWETLRVTGLAQSWSGDGKMPPRRARAAQLLTAVSDVIAADESLGGACVRAQLASWSYRAMRTTDGVLAVVDFVILVEARRFDDE